MRLSMRWVGVFLCFLLLAGCGKKDPEIFKLVQLFQEAKYDEAIALAEKLVKANPDDSQAHRFLIKSAVAKGEQEKYKARYQELVQTKPEVAGYHFALGYLYSQTQDFDAAMQELEKSIELNPGIGYARYTLGWIYLQPEYEGMDLEKALAKWKEEEQLDPKSFGALQVYADRADYYVRIGDAEGAEKDYEKISMYAFAPGDRTGAKTLITRIRSLRDELARLKAEAKENPEDPKIRLDLGILQYKNGKVKEANETWLEAVRLDPDNATLRNYLGKGLLEDGRYEEAVEHFEKAAELDPTITTVYYNLAVAEEFIGKTGEAIAHYKKYVELNPMAPRLDEVKQRVATLEGGSGVKEEG